MLTLKMQEGETSAAVGKTAIRHVAIFAAVPAIILTLYIFNPVWRIYSDHGFMHQGIVYSLINGQFPPVSPILADAAILYPWAHHLVLATLVEITNIPVSWVFAGLNLLAVSLALAFAYAIGRNLDGHARTGVFAALLAVVSCNLFTRGPLVDVLQSTLPRLGFGYIVWEYKALVIAKFYNVNSNGLGIAAVLGWLLATLVYLRSERRHLFQLVAILISSSIVAFIYPVYTLNIAATMLLLFALSFLRPLGLGKTSILYAGFASAAGLLTAVPYLLVVSAGRTTAAIGSTHDIPWFLHKGLVLALALTVVAALIFLARHGYRRLLKECPAPWAFLGVFAVVSAISWLLLSQSGTEYKHLLICTVAAGLMAAPAMNVLFARRPIAAVALLGLLLTTFLGDWLTLMKRDDWPAFQPVVEDGATLRHPDAAEDALYRWVRTHTDVRDAFIDDQLLMPVLGQRPLYFAVDFQTEAVKLERARSGKEVADGWEWRPEDLVRQQGYDPVLIAKRKQAATDLLTQGRTSVPLDAASGRDIYVVARAPSLRNRLPGTTGAKKVYSSAAADIYRLR